MRGAAPSGECPRCDEAQPAGPDRLTTCVTCGLRFDASAPPRARPARRSIVAGTTAAEPGPAGVIVEPDRLLLPRQVFSGALNLAIALVPAAVATLGIVKGQLDYPYEYLGIAVLAVVALVRLPRAIRLAVGRRTLTVGERELVVEVVPFASTRVEIPRERVQRIIVTEAPAQDRSLYAYKLTARLDDDDPLLIRAEDEHLARFIATWLEDQLGIADNGLGALMDEAIGRPDPV